MFPNIKGNNMFIVSTVIIVMIAMTVYYLNTRINAVEKSVQTQNTILTDLVKNMRNDMTKTTSSSLSGPVSNDATPEAKKSAQMFSNEPQEKINVSDDSSIEDIESDSDSEDSSNSEDSSDSEDGSHSEDGSDSEDGDRKDESKRVITDGKSDDFIDTKYTNVSLDVNNLNNDVMLGGEKMSESIKTISLSEPMKDGELTKLFDERRRCFILEFKDYSWIIRFPEC